MTPSLPYHEGHYHVFFMGKELTEKGYEKTLSKGALEPADGVTETAPSTFVIPISSRTPRVRFANSAAAS